MSRLTSLSDTSTTLENYTYLVLGTVVVRAHPQPNVIAILNGATGAFHYDTHATWTLP